MVNASVRTMNLFGNQNVSTRKEVSFENKSDDFATMMDNSIHKAKNVDAKTSVQTDKKTSEVIKKDDFDKKYEVEVKKDTEAEKTEIDKSESDNVEIDKSEEVSESEEIMSGEDVKIPEEILNVIAGILNISIEELQNFIEKLDMSVEDLLNTENVTKLVMDLKNIDTKFELLVHEDANDIIKDIKQAVEQLMKEENQTTVSNEKIKDADNLKFEEAVGDEKPVGNENVASERVAGDGQPQIKTQTESASENQFNGNKEQETSENSEKATASNENLAGELKGNVLDEIELALDERVDENISTRIIRDITDNISVAVRQKMTSLEMQLNPEQLGRVTILLSGEESGIKAKITADTEMAKNAIEQQLTILKENLDKQGLKVTDIEVTIASHGFEQNLDKGNDKNENQQKKNNGIRQSLLDEINGISSEEEQTSDDIVMQALGNTVSYLA